HGQIEPPGNDHEVLSDRRYHQWGRRSRIGHPCRWRVEARVQERHHQGEGREHDEHRAAAVVLEALQQRRCGQLPPRSGHERPPWVAVAGDLVPVSSRNLALALVGSICRRAYSATAAMMMTPRSTSRANGSIWSSLKTLSSTPRISTAAIVPPTPPRPPSRRVPPGTTAAIESRSWPAP